MMHKEWSTLQVSVIVILGLVIVTAWGCAGGGGPIETPGPVSPIETPTSAPISPIEGPVVEEPGPSGDEIRALSERIGMLSQQIEDIQDLAGEMGPIKVQGGPLSYRFATLAECERERDMMRYSDEKTIVIICTDDYAIRREMKDTLDWLNYHPDNWWIYPSSYELLFLPVVE